MASGAATPTAPPPAETTSPAARILRQELGAEVLAVADWRGDLAITVTPRAWVQAATLLRDHAELDFKLFLDLCGVDYLDRDDHPERYAVVFHAYSVSQKHHVRLKIYLPESRPMLDTLVGVYKGANWFEREAWDLYGIVFTNHPNLTRILTHDAFVGHPMRKDYPTAQRHVLKEPKELLLKVPAGTEHVLVNIGPSHPAMHGTFRIQALLDGETIVESEAEIGYMHRNFEKMAESRTYWQIIPYTDRLNYCSSFMNGHGWALAVEKLLGVPAPPRAEAIRVILSEFSRIMDHFVAITTNVVDLGAITPFFVVFRAREAIYELLEACCGARLTVSYVRIGGLAQDVPDDFAARVRKTIEAVKDVTAQCEKLLTRNVIFASRFKDVGVLRQGRRPLLRLGGPLPPRQRRRLRHPQGPPLLGLRAVRLRRAGGHGGRLLRPLPGPGGGDPPERPHHRAGHWPSCPRAPSSSTTRPWPCPPRARSTRTSKP